MLQYAIGGFQELPAQRAKRIATIAHSPVELKIQYAEAATGETYGQWQVLVGGKQIGSYSDSIFRPDGFHPERTAWWGEVETIASCSSFPDGASCTSMGNGKLGTDPSALEFSNL